MDERELATLLTKIQMERGVDLSGYKSSTFIRKVDARLQALHIDSLLEYIRFLGQNPAEYDRFIEIVTTNVTEFFRDMRVFKEIERSIIPQIIQYKRQRNNKIIRVWSAGTASGEEAYSLAILFCEQLGPRINDFVLKIYGTDIDHKCLERAKQAEYSFDEVKKMDNTRIAKYFIQANDKYRLIDGIKEMVTFLHHDLVHDEPLRYMDLVVCRNVLIYFSKDAQVKICAKLSQSLNDCGYLVLGLVESIVGRSKIGFKTLERSLKIYQKNKNFL